jgi:hypothetical protein
VRAISELALQHAACARHYALGATCHLPCAVHRLLLCPVCLVPCASPSACAACPCRFVVGHSVEENVHQLCQQRAAAMDLHAAAVAKGRAAADALSAGDVAALLRSEWEQQEGGEAQLDTVVTLD